MTRSEGLLGAVPAGSPLSEGRMGQPRRHSVVAQHGQLTWTTADGQTIDENVTRPPVVTASSSAVAMLPALTVGGDPLGLEDKAQVAQAAEL